MADRLVFTVFYCGDTCDGHIHTANSDGSDRRTITTDGRRPAWSPSGKAIAYERLEGIFIENARGVGGRRLSLTDYGSDPRWSPDGTRIVYTNLGDGIAIVNTTGGRPRLIDPPRGALEPDWSPDGTRIAFSGNSGLNDAIYVMNVDGSAVRKITRPPPGAQDMGVRWSPDGERLLFYREGLNLRDANGNWLLRVYTVSPRGGPMKLLFIADVTDLSWSPDGKQVAYANGKIRIFDLASRRHRLVRLKPCIGGGSCQDVDW